LCYLPTKKISVCFSNQNGKRKEKKAFSKSCENQGFIISKIHGFCFGISQSFFILMQEKLCGKVCSNVAMKRVVAKRIMMVHGTQACKLQKVRRSCKEQREELMNW
jgi:hypothetical protein